MRGSEGGAERERERKELEVYMAKRMKGAWVTEYS